MLQFAAKQWIAERRRLEIDNESDEARTSLARYILLKCMRMLSTGDTLVLHLRAAHELGLPGA